MQLNHKIKFLFLFAIAALLLQGSLYSQQSDSITLSLSGNVRDTLNLRTAQKNISGAQFMKEKYKVNYLKIGVITGATAGAFLWLHNYQKNSWWSGQRGKFHFQNDWDYAMSADKFGHFFDGAFIQALYRGGFEWAGLSPTASQWLGAAFSVAYMTDIEIEDGFATDWGFSPGDQMANVAGALYPVAQYYWKPLRSVNLKWSYYPSEEILSGKKHGAFLDDYNGQTGWISFNLWDVLPKKAKKFWPDYLNIAAGYGVNNYTDLENRYADLYFGLDLNWERILPGNSKFMLWFKNVLNHFRFLPLPVLKFNKDGVTYSVNF